MQIPIGIFSEAKHCPVTSDCRAMITKPLPVCQSETIFKLFDETYKSEGPKCSCCFACIRSHSQDRCSTCAEFLDTFFPAKRRPKVKKSVAMELSEAMIELFSALGY